MSSAPTPDRAVRGFLETSPPPDRYGHVYDPDEASGIICTLIQSGARVLDVGCGNGSLALILRDRCGAEVLGIEPDPERAELARANGVEVATGHVDDGFAAREPAFDVVLFADVLEHVPEPFELIEKALLCLSPSGYLVISVPNAAHWSVRLMILRGRFDYEPFGILDATHLRWFTHESIVRFLERAGCTVHVVRFSTGHSLPAYCRPPWSWIPGRARRYAARLMTRILPRLFGCQVIVSAGLARR